MKSEHMDISIKLFQSNRSAYVRTCVQIDSRELRNFWASKFDCIRAYMPSNLFKSWDWCQFNVEFQSNWAAYMRTCVQIGSRELRNFWASKFDCVRAYMRTNLFKSRNWAQFNVEFRSNWAAYMRTCVQIGLRELRNFFGFKIWLCTCVDAYKSLQISELGSVQCKV